MADANRWTLEKAKNGLSEVVRRALDHQPQVVVRSRREEDAVVVIARSDYERLLAPRNLVDFLRESPLAEAVAAGELGDVAAHDPFARPRDMGRDVAF
jgi:prevent-host-death family protein